MSIDGAHIEAKINSQQPQKEAQAYQIRHRHCMLHLSSLDSYHLSLLFSWKSCFEYAEEDGDKGILVSQIQKMMLGGSYRQYGDLMSDFDCSNGRFVVFPISD